MFNRDCRQTPYFGNMPQDGSIDISNNSGTIDINFDQDQAGFDSNINGMGMDMSSNFQMGMTQSPIIEPMRERVVNRTFEHVVPHVCPIRTKIVNHHIFKHTYSPSYSCCEENVCQNVQCGSCCNY